MFVFRAAVVGAGTMGGQIAQTIAAAGIPVVLKDIDDALVQAGLDEARNVTGAQAAKLVERGKARDGGPARADGARVGPRDGAQGRSNHCKRVHETPPTRGSGS